MNLLTYLFIFLISSEKLKNQNINNSSAKNKAKTKLVRKVDICLIFKKIKTKSEFGDVGCSPLFFEKYLPNSLLFHKFVSFHKTVSFRFALL